MRTTILLAPPGAPTAAPPASGAPITLPSNVGSGFNVYSSASPQVTRPIYSLGHQVSGGNVGKFDIMVPEGVTLGPLDIGQAKFSSSSATTLTASELSDVFAVNAGVKGIVGGFSGSLKGSFKLDTSGKVSHVYSLYQTLVQRYNLAITNTGAGLSTSFTDAARAVSKSTWQSDPSVYEEFFALWGSHVVTSATMGARLWGCLSTSVSTHITNLQISANLEASYGPISGEISGSYDGYKKDVLEETYTQVLAYGGALMASAAFISDDGTLKNEVLRAWVASCDDEEWPSRMQEVGYKLTSVVTVLRDVLDEASTSNMATAWTAWCKEQAAKAGLPSGAPVVVTLRLVTMDVNNDGDAHSAGEFYWTFKVKDLTATTELGDLSVVSADACVPMADKSSKSFVDLIAAATAKAGSDAAAQVRGSGSLQLQFYPTNVSDGFLVHGSLFENDGLGNVDPFHSYESGEFTARNFFGASDHSGAKSRTKISFTEPNGLKGNVDVVLEISFSPPL